MPITHSALPCAACSIAAFILVHRSPDPEREIMYRARLRFLIVLLAVVLPGALCAQQRTAVQWADSIRSAIDHSVIRAHEQGLKEALALAERALTVFPDDAMLLHYRGYAGYRLWTLPAHRGDTPTVEAAINAFE